MKSNELRTLAVILLAITAAAEIFLIRSIYYTVGEVMQGLYGFLVWLNVPLLALVLWRPGAGLRGIIILAALLLPWPAWRSHKWTVIHEDVVPLVKHLEEAKTRDGEYPGGLDGYRFKTGWVKDHVHYEKDGDRFRLAYFLDDMGTHYWYHSGSGFGYYGD